MNVTLGRCCKPAASRCSDGDVPSDRRALSLAKTRSRRLDVGRAPCEPWTPMALVLALLGALRAALRSRTDLTLENLALRQQLALLRPRSKRPQFGHLDRLF